MNSVTSAPTPEPFDVVVIGAGVVGSAVARQLSGYRLRVGLVDARPDVGDVTSKANTAILHTGFDAKPGSLESRLVHDGYRLLGDYAAQVGIPVERTGALLVAWNSEQFEALPGLAAKAQANGYAETFQIDADEVYQREPRLGPGALGGLVVPGESIICPWTTTLAYATEAKARGAVLLLGRRVTGIEVGAELTTLATEAGPISTRWVVNAAGLGSDHLDQAFGYQRFTVTPRRGELFVFDKLTRPMVSEILLPVPSAKGKGVLISPTIYGNVMLGPTAEDLTDRTDTSTSAGGFAELLAKGATIMPELLAQEVTASYAGLRAATEHSDYVVDVDPAQRYLCLGGIRSTGLTSSMALAVHAAELLAGAGLELAEIPEAEMLAPPRMAWIGQVGTRPFADADKIAADPAYGEIVCFCERVTRGEIRDALASPIPPIDRGGLGRRTRATNGRCQGFFCGARVDELLNGGKADA
ncbi:glycerol-3-phosphate dehydrogenase [Propionicimonas paludicola]|uniref:Glycerol-3-phosphate dehydrogenase n=1 Tax=Propionicimonas paludicola TaxID=185243 RepID=A0A2A9CTZ1_9ACTN|nr:NAD(P)/FAD-dependent oxidoreductase [Propionicimonas paludicola]PFG17112.1 glycerol-3-phosphate dehydrogenase [Propionicimonas paludicola]